jgi:microcystin-dependent protein
MAEHTTPTMGLPYPDAKGKVSVGPKDLQELAERVETVLSEGATKLHPIGAIKGSLLASPAPGWLVCNWEEVSQTEYAALYAVVKGKYGAAAAGNFRLPAMQLRYPIGASGTRALGAYGGENEVALTAAQSGIQAHKHCLHNPAVATSESEYTMESPYGPESFRWRGYEYGAGTSELSYSFITNTGNPRNSAPVSPHPNTPPYFAVNFFIKYQ